MFALCCCDQVWFSGKSTDTNKLYRRIFKGAKLSVNSTQIDSVSPFRPLLKLQNKSRIPEFKAKRAPRKPTMDLGNRYICDLQQNLFQFIYVCTHIKHIKKCFTRDNLKVIYIYRIKDLW